MAKYHVGGKMIERGWKKGEKCIFFPQLVKSIHIFSPIDLKYTKLKQKKADIFGDKSRRGGAKNMNFIMKNGNTDIGKDNFIVYSGTLKMPFFTN